jgi:hypothetical protein
VVAIIALLISILLPSLNRAREQARTVVCLANLRSIGQGISLYVNEADDSLPGPLHPPIYREAGAVIDELEGDSEFDEMSELNRQWFLLGRLAPVMAGGSDPYHELVDQVATCPTAANFNPDENFAPNIAVPGRPIDDDNSGSNPNWSKPFHYLPNTWNTTDPFKYFGWINLSWTWESWEDRVEDELAEYRNTGRKPGFARPVQTAKITRPADEWAVGEAWTKLISGGRGRPTARAGTWLDPAERNGGSHNPLPTRPIHNRNRGTGMLYFDGHASLHMLGGTEAPADLLPWFQQFPGNPDDDFREAWRSN